MRFEDRVVRGDFAREITFGYGRPTRSPLEGVVTHFDPLTAAELRVHAAKFGSQSVGRFMPAKQVTEDLSAKSQAADLQELARKRSKRRRNITQEARALLDRRPGLMPQAVADTLNISDRSEVPSPANRCRGRVGVTRQIRRILGSTMRVSGALSAMRR